MINGECGCWRVVNSNDVESNGVGHGCCAIGDGVVEVGDAVEVGIGGKGEVGIGVKGDGAVGGSQACDLEVVDIFNAIGADIRVGNTVKEISCAEGVGGVFCAVGESDGINRKDWRIVKAKDVDVDGFADGFRCIDDVAVAID